MHDAVHENRGSDDVSGEIAPTGTISSASTIVYFRGLAMIGLKLRAARRISEVSQLVGLLRLDQGVVRMDRHSKMHRLPSRTRSSLADGHFRSNANRGVEAQQASGGRRMRSHKMPWGTSSQVTFAFRKTLLKIIRCAGRGTSRSHASPAVLEHNASSPSRVPQLLLTAVIFFTPLLRQRLNQIIGKTGPPKPPNMIRAPSEYPATAASGEFYNFWPSFFAQKESK